MKITELRTVMKAGLLNYLHGFLLLKEPVVSIWESVYNSNVSEVSVSVPVK